MSEPLASERPSTYFVNGWLDAAVIGGLSIIVFLALRLFAGGVTAEKAIEYAAILAIFVNYPHFSATIYRLYQSPDNLRQFPVTAFGVPLLILAAVAASIWQPESVAPYFVTLLLVWSPFHYSGQTIGITMLYARRGGVEVGRYQRLALSAFVYSTFIVSFAYPLSTEPAIRYGISIPVIHFPAWFGMMMIAVMGIGAIVFLYFVLSWGRSQQRLPPAIILLPAAAQFVWFMPGKQIVMFYELVPLFHSLQYLYIAWALQIGLRMGGKSQADAHGSLWQESLRWALRNYAGGMLLFIALPWLLFWVDLPMATTAGIVLAAVNIHHFFVDGVIWKLRNTSSSSPLMMNATNWASTHPLVPA
jgi:hypothetical protein